MVMNVWDFFLWFLFFIFFIILHQLIHINLNYFITIKNIKIKWNDINKNIKKIKIKFNDIYKNSKKINILLKIKIEVQKNI